VPERDWRRKATGRGQVARLPDRIELVLERTQALEVVEVLAVAEEQRAELVPQWREPVLLEAGERRYAEAGSTTTAPATVAAGACASAA
jgi:hypothetical protein